MEKNTQNETKSNENEFKSKLEQVELREKASDNNISLHDVGTSFVCPDFVLDFLQDKPILFQKIILSHDLSSDQKKKIEHIFKINADEIGVFRSGIKEFIEELCKSNPSLTPFFSTKMVFFGMFSFGFYERKCMVSDILAVESEVKKD